MFSASCALISILILVWVVKYRIHVHISYTPSSSRGYRSARKTVESQAPSRRRQIDPGPNPQSAWGAELRNALSGLGCKAAVARGAVERALAAQPASFEAALRGAIREATT